MATAFDFNALIAPSIMSGIGWIGLLAKNYYTDMAKLAIKRAEQDQNNEQRRLDKSEQYFEMLLNRLLVQNGEQEDKRLALEEQLIKVGQDISLKLEQLRDEIHSLTVEQAHLKHTIQKTTDPTRVN